VIRTHDAGTLRASDAGQTVTLAGWVATRRDHGGVTFIDLRDRSGLVQVVVREDAVAHDLRAEWVLKVVGEVRARETQNDNPNLPTGEIEVAATSIEVLNAAAPLPFQLDAYSGVERVRIGVSISRKSRALSSSRIVRMTSWRSSRASRIDSRRKSSGR
jgi:aspartyl-tRNA synthetase